MMWAYAEEGLFPNGAADGDTMILHSDRHEAFIQWTDTASYQVLHTHHTHTQMMTQPRNSRIDRLWWLAAHKYHRHARAHLVSSTCPRFRCCTKATAQFIDGFNATEANNGLCDAFPPPGPEGRFWTDCTGRGDGDICSAYCTLGYVYAYADGTAATATAAAAALSGEQVRARAASGVCALFRFLFLSLLLLAVVRWCLPRYRCGNHLLFLLRTYVRT